jgi:nucleotide-binding universal stress UspA family protein
MKSEILITTNGFKDTWRAIEYGAWLAQSMKMRVKILGVNESSNPASKDNLHPLEEIFARAVELFQQQGVEYSTEIQNGAAEQVIPQIANSGDFLTVVSPLGRPRLRRWLTGRSIRPLMERIQVPILYVPEIRLPLKKMLISAGGLGYEVIAENLAFQIAVANNADVTILHVFHSTDVEYPGTRNVREHLKNLQDTDTLVGRSLRNALEVAQKEGLNAKATIRQGNVVEQILAEIKEGNYDMVCMGSPYSASSLRQLYTPNVTAEVAESVLCPVLTARFKRE